MKRNSVCEELRVNRLEVIQEWNDLLQSAIEIGLCYARYVMPECPNIKKIKKDGLDQYGAERSFVDSFLPQSEKVWDWNG